MNVIKDNFSEFADGLLHCKTCEYKQCMCPQHNWEGRAIRHYDSHRFERALQEP